jgi:hypothetical protein
VFLIGTEEKDLACRVVLTCFDMSTNEERSTRVYDERQAIDDVPKTGFGFACSLAFMLVLDVLPWLFLVSFCVVFSVVCRRCCYTVATWVILGLGSLALLVSKLLAELFWIGGLWQSHWWDRR